MSGAPQAATAGWRRRKDRRQPEILEAARKLIEEEGAASTSMARIAAASGVSEATVYKYFDSKQDLVNQVLREWATPFIERLTAELEHVSGLRSRLLLIAIRFLRAFEETPKLHRFFFQEVRWSDYRGSPIHKLNQRFVSAVVGAVEEGIRNGEVRVDVDPAMLRDMLFGGLEHIAMRTSLVGRGLDIEEEASRYVDLMLRGCMIQRSSTDMSSELGRLANLVDRLERAQGH